MSKSDYELFGLKSSRTGKYLKSNNADKMFKELGYKKNEYIEAIYYIKNDESDEQTIEFDKTIKCVFSYANKDEYYVMGTNIEELQAINKKCEELGWI